MNKKKLEYNYLFKLYYNFFIDIIKKNFLLILLSLISSLAANLAKLYLILSIASYISNKKINLYFYIINEVDINFFLFFLIITLIFNSLFNLISEKIKYKIWRNYSYLKIEEFFLINKSKNNRNIKNLKSFILSINRIGIMAKTSINIINSIVILICVLILIFFYEPHTFIYFILLTILALIFFQFFKEDIYYKNASYDKIIKNFKILINNNENTYTDIFDKNKSQIKKYLSTSVNKIYISDIAKFKFFLSIGLGLFFTVLLVDNFNVSLNIKDYIKFSSLLIIFIFNLADLIKQLANSLRFIEFTDINIIDENLEKKKDEEYE